MPEPIRPAARWRKSSLCTTNSCLEITRSNGLLRIRNSDQPGVTVSCTDQEWKLFRAGLFRGDFDDLTPEADAG